MANTLSRVEVKRLALIGAQSRLETLNAEIASIVRAFPELSRGRAKAATTTVANGAPRKGKGGRKRNWNMSADRSAPCPSACGSIGPAAARKRPQRPRLRRPDYIPVRRHS